MTVTTTIIGDKSIAPLAAHLVSALKFLAVGAVVGAVLVSGAELTRRAGAADRGAVATSTR